MTEERYASYCKLIDELLRCPNGSEPDVLDANLELIDEGLIRTMMQIATNFAHKGNQEGAKFLIFLSRQLAKNLGLYPELATE
ncbi:MAG: hypothetical protein AAGA60_13535 [Cyanobacteria bacterium P01_E01_bin.42]